MILPRSGVQGLIGQSCQKGADLAPGVIKEMLGVGIEITGARGGQAHLWGAKHATRWAWAHCNDFTDPAGQPRRETFLDGVSVFVPRFGRELGPNTPVVGRFGGKDLGSTSPLVVLRNDSDFDLEGWSFEARGRGIRVRGSRASLSSGPRSSHASASNAAAASGCGGA